MAETEIRSVIYVREKISVTRRRLNVHQEYSVSDIPLLKLEQSFIE